MGDNSFPKDEEWNTDAICDAEQQGKDLTTQEIDISQSPHLWASRFSGMWAYGSHLRVEEKDKGKGNCDFVVSVEFHHKN